MVTDAEVIEILDNIDMGDAKPNTEKVEFERLLDYVNVSVMGYPKEECLPEAMINSVRNAVATLKLHKDGFSCRDLISVLKNCDEHIQRCNGSMKYKNELHRLNTALSIAKNRYIDSLILRKQRERAVNSQEIVIPQCKSDAGLKARLIEKCANDEYKCNVVIASLIQAWCDGRIQIEGI